MHRNATSHFHTASLFNMPHSTIIGGGGSVLIWPAAEILGVKRVNKAGHCIAILCLYHHLMRKALNCLVCMYALSFDIMPDMMSHIFCQHWQIPQSSATMIRSGTYGWCFRPPEVKVQSIQLLSNLSASLESSSTGHNTAHMCVCLCVHSLHGWCAQLARIIFSHWATQRWGAWADD